MNGENKKNVLICDIGGTNVRFGLYDRQQGDNVVFDGKYKCVEFSSFEEAVGKYLKKKKEKPTLCVIGAAGDLNESETEILVTNTPWKASIPKLKSQFPFFKHVRMVNDFALQGWALSELTADQYKPVFGTQKTSLKKGKVVVIGPGTGLGTCLVMQEGRKQQAIYTSEAGHNTLPHVDFKDRDMNEWRDILLNGLKKHYAPQTPITEHIVSGTGISNIYHLCISDSIPKDKKLRIPAEQVENLAKAGDENAIMTFKFFNAYLGAHAGTLAATTKTKHIFFCGGLMASPWVLGQLEQSSEFMDQFTERAALSNAMNSVRFSASLYRDMSTLGAVVRARRLLDLDDTEKAKARANKDLLFKLTALQAIVEQEGGPDACQTMKKLISSVEKFRKAQQGRGAYRAR